DDRGLARALALAKTLGVEEAVDAGEADVEDDRVGEALEDHALGLDHVAGVTYVDPLELERGADERTELYVVVDHQDLRLGRHLLTPRFSDSFDCLGVFGAPAGFL